MCSQLTELTAYSVESMCYLARHKYGHFDGTFVANREPDTFCYRDIVKQCTTIHPFCFSLPYSHKSNMQRNGPLLHETEIWTIIMQLTAGLRAIHQAGLACRFVLITTTSQCVSNVLFIIKERSIRPRSS